MSGYVGINDKSKKIKSLYVGVNNVARKVKSAYIGVNGVAKQWYNGDGPNDQYESKSIGTWSSLSDVDTFFNTYKPDNSWTGLKLGNIIRINDGTYNADWEIAGFNMEHNQTAADGTIYDNGYGICMIPKIRIVYDETLGLRWNDSNTLYRGYKASHIHNELNTTVANKLKTILGDHLINRNVLLSSAYDFNSSSSSAYTWTTAYVTLMSICQLTGQRASHNNKYDDGEANYKLPLFNYENYTVQSYGYWLRCIWGSDGAGRYCVWVAGTSGISNYSVYPMSMSVRPLIYLR